MLIMSHVSVEFRDQEGNSLMVIGEHQLNQLIPAPDNLWEDPLFHLMIADGSLVAPEGDACKELEADPLAGLTADGKSEVPRRPVRKGNAEAKSAEAKTSAPAKETKKKAEADSGTKTDFGPEQKP